MRLAGPAVESGDRVRSGVIFQPGRRITRRLPRQAANATPPPFAELLERLEQVLDDDMALIDVLLPYGRGDLLSLAHQRGIILSEGHEESGTKLVARVPKALRPIFDPYSRI